MKRKLVKQGAATLMVSLPSKWIKQFSLKKGNEIDVEEKGRDIIIRSEPSKEVRKVKINISEMGLLGKRSIGALYKAGYDEIEIDFEKAEEISKVYSVLNELIGFEIIKQSEKGCVIKEITSASESNFDTIFNRTFLMLISVSEDCVSSIKNRNFEMLATIPDRDLIINKYANFCRRILNRGYAGTEKTPMLYYIIEELENLGDEYKHLARFFVEKKIRANQKTVDVLEKINALAKDFYSLNKKFEKGSAVSFGEKIKKTSAEISELLKTKNVDEIKMLDYMSRMVQIIFNMLGPLMTMAL